MNIGLIADLRARYRWIDESGQVRHVNRDMDDALDEASAMHDRIKKAKSFCIAQVNSGANPYVFDQIIAILEGRDG